MGAATTYGGRKAPPAFVKSEWAWAYTLQKLDAKGNTDEHGNPTNYAAACAIYKRVVAKYGSGAEPEVEEVETIEADRATLVRLESPVWVVGRGCAWAADDVSNRRLYLQATLRKSRGASGKVVTDPLFFWRCEIQTDDAAKAETISVTVESALWITEQDAGAQAWVRSRTEEALGELDEALGDLTAGGDGLGDEAGQFFDKDESLARIQRKQDEFEDALS